MMGKAIIYTNGKYNTPDAKTAHGLVRGTSRFEIIGVIDHVCAGKEAGTLLDGRDRNIPIYGTLGEFLEKSSRKADYAVIGVALSGGRLPEDWNGLLLEALENHISLVGGTHQPMSDRPILAEAARNNSVRIIDIRKPKPIEELHFWSGDIYKVKAPVVAVLGTDCAMGKRTTCRIVTEACQAHGIRAEMVYTGQTGWLQGYPYGFIFDATPNDFVSGELEHAIVQCDRETNPDVIFLEGQSGLRNPSGPCGSEFILSGNAKNVILQHAPFRTYFDELEAFECLLPSLEDEIDLIQKYGAKVLAVTLNDNGAGEEEMEAYRNSTVEKLSRPVIRPLKDGPEQFVSLVRGLIDD